METSPSEAIPAEPPLRHRRSRIWEISSSFECPRMSGLSNPCSQSGYPVAGIFSAAPVHPRDIDPCKDERGGPASVRAEALAGSCRTGVAAPSPRRLARKDGVFVRAEALEKPVQRL